MKRILAAALMIGVFSTCGFVGCGEKSEQTVKETTTSPGGTTETTVDKTVKSTGENPPPNTAGETAKTPQ